MVFKTANICSFGLFFFFFGCIFGVKKERVGMGYKNQHLEKIHTQNLLDVWLVKSDTATS